MSCASKGVHQVAQLFEFAHRVCDKSRCRVHLGGSTQKGIEDGDSVVALSVGEIFADDRVGAEACCGAQDGCVPVAEVVAVTQAEGGEYQFAVDGFTGRLAAMRSTKVCGAVGNRP